jgi:hypothetical protein
VPPASADRSEAPARLERELLAQPGIKVLSARQEHVVKPGQPAHRAPASQAPPEIKGRQALQEFGAKSAQPACRDKCK